MKTKLLLLLLLLALPLRADVESHRRAAVDLIGLINGPAAMRTGALTVITPMLNSFRQQGAPEAALQELKGAIEDWVDQDLVWAEITPQLAELYMQQFSEDELKQLLAFYHSPLGLKALAQLPAIATASAGIGQDYVKSKEALLKERIIKVIAKYQSAPAAPATDSSAPNAPATPKN